MAKIRGRFEARWKWKTRIVMLLIRLHNTAENKPQEVWNRNSTKHWGRKPKLNWIFLPWWDTDNIACSMLSLQPTHTFIISSTDNKSKIRNISKPSTLSGRFLLKPFGNKELDSFDIQWRLAFLPYAPEFVMNMLELVDLLTSINGTHHTFMREISTDPPSLSSCYLKGTFCLSASPILLLLNLKYTSISFLTF